MTNQSLLAVGTEFIPKVARRVYCAEDAPLRLSDGTPLHLEWIIEGTDGMLFTVRSELGSWRRRTPYQGPLDGMKLVSSEKAKTIMWLTDADTDGAKNAGEGLEEGDEHVLVEGVVVCGEDASQLLVFVAD